MLPLPCGFHLPEAGCSFSGNVLLHRLPCGQDIMVGLEFQYAGQDHVKKILGTDFLHLLRRQYFRFAFEHIFSSCSFLFCKNRKNQPFCLFAKRLIHSYRERQKFLFLSFPASIFAACKRRCFLAKIVCILIFFLSVYMIGANPCLSCSDGDSSSPLARVISGKLFKNCSALR